MKLSDSDNPSVQIEVLAKFPRHGVMGYTCLICSCQFNNLFPLPVHQGEAGFCFLRFLPFQPIPSMFGKSDLWLFVMHNQEERAKIYERQGERI